MPDQPQPSDESPPPPRPEPETVAAGLGPAATGSEGDAAGALTAEEQMALFEKSLKESDWGHQPC